MIVYNNLSECLALNFLFTSNLVSTSLLYATVLIFNLYFVHSDFRPWNSSRWWRPDGDGNTSYSEWNENNDDLVLGEVRRTSDCHAADVQRTMSNLLCFHLSFLTRWMLFHCVTIWCNLNHFYLDFSSSCLVKWVLLYIEYYVLSWGEKLVVDEFWWAETEFKTSQLITKQLRDSKFMPEKNIGTLLLIELCLCLC